MEWQGKLLMLIFFSFIEKVSPDGNTTTSVLTYVPSLEDQAKVISCRVEHTLLAYNSMEQGRKLTIQCKTSFII